MSIHITLESNIPEPLEFILGETQGLIGIDFPLTSPASLVISPVSFGVKGETGAQGADGREISMQVSDGYIQWKYSDDETWVNLIAVSALKGDTGAQGIQGYTGATGASGSNGADGQEVQLQKTATYIQWKYTDDVSWTNLVALTDITGAQGVQGATGATGAAGTNGVDGDDGISAYQVAVNNGFSGTESQWLASLIGAKGDKGDTGATGSTGLQGSPGPGLASGGTSGQFARKKSTTDYDTEWHSLTKSDVGLGSVVNTDTTTTANISDSTDKRFVTDAQKTVIQNTSGSNTGDETSTSIKTKLGISTLSGSNTGDQDLSSLALKSTTINSKGLSANIVLTQDDIGDGTTYKQYSTTEKSKLSGIASGATVGADWNVNVSNKPTLGTSSAKDVPSAGNASSTQVVLGSDTRLSDARTPSAHTHPESEITNLATDLAGKVAANTAITGATKTKITYDSKGLVTSGADATTADIASSTDKRYVTDAQLTLIGNTSGSNTGDETASTIRTKLGITTLSGSNTGDETTATVKTKLGAATASVDGYATAAQITKLDGIATGAEVNVNADWNASSGDAQILNKPTLGSLAALSAVSESNLQLSDNTTANASTTAHGLLPRLDGNTGNYLRGDGTWATPPSGSGGSSTLSKVTITTNLIVSDEQFIICNCLSGSFNVTLPNASSATKPVYIKKIDSSKNTATVVGTIDGETNYVLELEGEFVQVAPDGTSWQIIAE